MADTVAIEMCKEGYYQVNIPALSEDLVVVVRLLTRSKRVLISLPHVIVFCRKYIREKLNHDTSFMKSYSTNHPIMGGLPLGVWRDLCDTVVYIYHEV